MKRIFFLVVAFMYLFVGCNKTEVKNMSSDNIRIKYLGHASLKIYFNGKICYIDPYAGDDYEEPADLVLITHEHQDHNEISLLKLKSDTKIIHYADVVDGNSYNKVKYKEMEIEPVEAYNKNHKKGDCVGYVLRVNGKTIYVAGDTSTTEQMKKLGDYNIDYAFLPIDGKYNMGIDEAIECEKLIKAKHTIPYHVAPGQLYNLGIAKKFVTPTTLIVQPNEVIEVK